VLSPTEGARLFRDELVFGAGGEVAIAGKVSSAPGFDEVLAHEPGTRLVATRTFGLSRDAWLADHVIAGSPWLPAVAGIELMARAAAVLAPGLRIAELENLEIPRAVKILRGQPATVRVTAEADPAESNGERRIAVRIESDVVRLGRVLQRDRLHYRATVVCSPGAAKPPLAVRAPGNGPVPTAILYGPGGLLPHGPAFQLIERIASLGDESASGVVAAGLSLSGVSDEPPLTAPLAREAALQVSGVWALLRHDVLVLPSGCRRIELFGPVPAGVGLRAEAFVGNVSEDEIEFDLVLAGEDGRVYDRMSGYRAVRVSGDLRT
jgi:predicted hotdog family 3-hydroxylacyl-ACP dehydratase